VETKSVFIFHFDAHVLQREEAVNPELDFRLMRTCKREIKDNCMSHLDSGNIDHLVKCLVKYKAKLRNP